MVHATVLLVYGYTYTVNIYNFGNRLTATGLPAALHYVVTPIAGALMILVLLGKIAEQLMQKEDLKNG
jgi:TRAP-type C4-dicarboxylate transport system permease small subunit